VGTLSCQGDEDSIEFRFLGSYLSSYPRPVLGQAFEDDLSRFHKSRMRLPPFFSNLLPEGALRSLIATQAEVAEGREFWLLRLLGEDLPGAARAVPADDEAAASEAPQGGSEPGDGPGEADSLRFSVAGIQLKFSVVRRGKALVIPARGRGGDWLVKLPDPRFENIPRSEYSALQWARNSGIEVPEIELVAVENIENLPPEVGELRERQALALRRFDRDTQAPDGRIHQEDLAQVLSLYPEKKYSEFNYETIARVVRSVAGHKAYRRFIDRLVFMVALGNGDAHHKNWSLIYPDGVQADLSPAYDLVPTRLYLPEEQMALNLARSKSWSNVQRASFRRLARKVDADEAKTEERARAAVERIRRAWRDSQAELLWSDEERRRIEGWWREIPLLQDR
jgi:serine/threonine-protein kinase HipA